MLTWLVAIVASQAIIPVKIINPENQSQGIGGATAIKVNCVSGCSGSSASTQGLSNDGGYDWHSDLEQVAGVPVNVGLGTAGTGTQRVAVASDSTVGVTGNVTVVQPTAASLNATVTGTVTTSPPANASSNVSQWIGSTAPSVGSKTSANSLPVVIASDQAAVTVSGTVTTSPPANASTNVAQWVGSTAPSVGSKTSANSIPVVIASDQGAVTVSGTVTTTPPSNASTNLAQVNAQTVNVGTGTAGTGTARVAVASDSSITANAGTNLNTSALALDATLTGRTAKIQITDGTRDGTVKAGSTLPAATDTAMVVTTRDTVTVSGTVTTSPPSNASTNVAQWIGSTAPSVGSKTSANSLPVVIASDQAAVPVTLTSTTITGTVAATESGTWTVQPGNTANTTPWLTTDTPRTVSSANQTGTCTSVAATTTVLASNASRRAYGFKASEANTDRVYCKLGATATTANMPFGAGSAWSQDTGAVYTGVIDCIANSGTQTVCVFEFN